MLEKLVGKLGPQAGWLGVHHGLFSLYCALINPLINLINWVTCNGRLLNVMIVCVCVGGRCWKLSLVITDDFLSMLPCSQSVSVGPF